MIPQFFSLRHRPSFYNSIFSFSILQALVLVLTTLWVTLLVQSSASAQTWTWTGQSGVDRLWSNSGNWDNGLPTSGFTTDLIMNGFDDGLNDPVGGTFATQDLAQPFLAQSMSINTSAGDININGGPTRIRGGDLSISGGRRSILYSGVEIGGGSEVQIDNSVLYFSPFDTPGGGLLAEQANGDVRVNGRGQLWFQLSNFRGNYVTGDEVSTFIFDSLDMTDTTINFGGSAFLAQSALTPDEITFNAPSSMMSFNTLSSINTKTMTVNDRLTVDFGELRINVEDAAITGTGSIQATNGGILTLEGNTTLDLRVAIDNGNFDGGTSSQINGPVTISNGSVSGNVEINGTISCIGDGQNQPTSSLLNNSVVTANELTTIDDARLVVESGAQFDGSGAVTVFNLGTLDVRGTVSKDVNVLEDGVLQGTGLIDGNLVIDGLLEPGNSAGILEVDGDISLTETSTVCIEIGGPETGEFDVIDGRGVSNLTLDGGLLDIVLLDGFRPDNLDRFEFLANFGSLSGTFGSAFDGSGGSGFQSFFGGGQRIDFDEGSFAIEYQTGSVSLTDFRPIAVPEPTAAALLGSLSLVLLIRRKRYSI